MRKRWIAGAAAAAVGLCAALAAWFQPAAPGTVYETAALLLESGQEQLFVLGETADQADGVFRALEAVVPAPFVLRCTQYERLPVTRFALERRGKAAQEQAAVLAQGMAREAVRGLTDPAEQLRALHDVLIRGCVYDAPTATRSPDTLDGFLPPFTAYGALLEGKAVCAGYARAYMLLAQAAGFEVIYVTSPEMNHGWNAVRLDGVTYYIDCTFDDPTPDMGQYVLHDYCLVTAEQLRRTHAWDEAFYEALLDQMEKP